MEVPHVIQFNTGFPWNKPSSYWDTCTLGNLHILAITILSLQTLLGGASHLVAFDPSLFGELSLFNPTYPTYHWGYSRLANWGEPPSTFAMRFRTIVGRFPRGSWRSSRNGWRTAENTSCRTSRKYRFHISSGNDGISI